MKRTAEVMVPHLAAGSGPPRLADALGGQRHIFVRDLVLSCNIGVYRHERDAPQRVRLNIDLAIADDLAGTTDRLGDTVSYETFVDRARSIVGERHYNLVETLAEALAAMCLDDSAGSPCPHPGRETGRLHRYRRGRRRDRRPRKIKPEK